MECILKQCKNSQRSKQYCAKHYHSHVFLKSRPLYNTWMNMKRRCYDTNHVRYKDWGGRGIKMDPLWIDDYFAFENAVGKKPSPFHQLDRIDNDGDYNANNVRWTTTIIQARNRRVKRNTQSGFRGIEVRGNAYVARITVNKRRINLGTFYNINEALIARARAEGIYF